MTFPTHNQDPNLSLSKMVIMIEEYKLLDTEIFIM